MCTLAPSSSGPGYLVLIQKIAGSNPAGVTKIYTSSHDGVFILIILRDCTYATSGYILEMTGEINAMRYVTFNVLADAYTTYGDYSHVNPKLLVNGARLDHIIHQVNSFGADVVGLQEADRSLLEAFEDDERWQALWSPKGRNKPDGCLTLVKSGIEIANHESFLYDDESGHVFQLTRIGHISVANTHIKWAPVDEPDHIGISQTQLLLSALGDLQPAVILADCNDRPGGPVQTLIESAGFTSMSADKPTAIVNGELVALDLLAIRGVHAQWVPTDYDLDSIPSETCASDHIPLIADVDV
jgi:hypothetical protein